MYIYLFTDIAFASKNMEVLIKLVPDSKNNDPFQLLNPLVSRKKIVMIKGFLL